MYFLTTNSLNVLFFKCTLFVSKLDTPIIPTNGFYSHDGNLLPEVGFEPTPTEVDCDLNAAPYTTQPSRLVRTSCHLLC